MKKISTAALVSFIIISVFLACKKNDACVGGSGGSVTLVAYPQHHSKPILNQMNHLDSAYVKYNTQDLPGTKASSYDAILVGEANEDHVHIPSLKCGKYYIYMVGYDTTIHLRVAGGTPIEITQSTGEKIITVPVTE